VLSGNCSIQKSEKIILLCFPFAIRWKYLLLSPPSWTCFTLAHWAHLNSSLWRSFVNSSFALRITFRSPSIKGIDFTLRSKISSRSTTCRTIELVDVGKNQHQSGRKTWNYLHDWGYDHMTNHPHVQHRKTMQCFYYITFNVMKKGEFDIKSDYIPTKFSP
jgi:hypothetical protein